MREGGRERGREGGMEGVREAGTHGGLQGGTLTRSSTTLADHCRANSESNNPDSACLEPFSVRTSLKSFEVLRVRFSEDTRGAVLYSCMCVSFDAFFLSCLLMRL